MRLFLEFFSKYLNFIYIRTIFSSLTLRARLIGDNLGLNTRHVFGTVQNCRYISLMGLQISFAIANTSYFYFFVYILISSDKNGIL